MEARQIDYAYEDGARAIHGVSLSMAPATLTAVIGSNGSGKSTLIRLLAGLLRPTAGTILLDGKPLEAWQPRLRAREIAYMPQATGMVFPFRAIDVVLSGRTPHAPRFGFESDRDRAIAIESLEAAGAGHLAERQVTALSGGEKQMVILARALAQQPRMLLLDEPAAALESEASRGTDAHACPAARHARAKRRNDHARSAIDGLAVRSDRGAALRRTGRRRASGRDPAKRAPGGHL
ncbi:MAG: ABC transporter ATP-binding protein [Ignavibacteriota bacterium]